MKPIVVLCLLASLATPLSRSLAAQAGPDQIKELLQKIQSEMEQIDKLLQEASTKPISRQAGAEPGAQPRPKQDEVDELLESSVKTSRSVVEQIEKLLEMAQQQQQQQQSQSQQQRDRQRAERERQRQPGRSQQDTPDHVQQQPQPGKDQPDSPRPDSEPGRNEKGKDPQNPEGGRTERDRSAESWGELPPYLQLLFRREGEPKVPAKYQHYTDEFHKRADRKKKQ
jgi:hypothetical protein